MGVDFRPEALVDVEFLRDIRPILESRCVSCHTRNSSSPPAELVLDDVRLGGGLGPAFNVTFCTNSSTWSGLSTDTTAESSHPATSQQNLKKSVLLRWTLCAHCAFGNQ